MPIVAIELKNAADAKANLQAAYNQIQTYKREIPSLFTYNALLIISDGISARFGSLSADYSRFTQWKRQLPNGSGPAPNPSQRKGSRTSEVERQAPEVPRPLGEGFREREKSMQNNDTNELEILTQGMLNQHTLLDLIRHFTVF